MPFLQAKNALWLFLITHSLVPSSEDSAPSCWLAEHNAWQHVCVETEEKPSWSQTDTVTSNKKKPWRQSLECFLFYKPLSWSAWWFLEPGRRDNSIISTFASLVSIKSPGAFIIIGQGNFSFWKGLGSWQVNWRVGLPCSWGRLLGKQVGVL